jgi:hypothetical protein
MAAALLRAGRVGALALPLLLAGCGSGNVAPVSGRVTIDGRPAVGVLVSFQPIGSADNQDPGPGSYGTTDEDGRYRLTQVVTNRPGAVVGPHRVSLRSPNGPPKPDVVIPKEYNKESTLQYDVPKGGTTTADFEVKTR